MSSIPSEKRVAGTRLPRQAGQMIIFASLSLTVLFSLLGLSADLGYSYYIQIEAQAAADAAATGAASYAKNNGYLCSTYVACNSTYSCPSSLTTATTALQAGCLYASANGFVDTGNQTVTLIANNTTPPNESGASPQLWIQANVSQTVSHMFLLLAGFASGPVGAHAIAGVNSTPNNDCIYILDTGSTADALQVSGSAVLTATGCGVYDDGSNTSTALNVAGSAKIIASEIKVNGGATIGGGASTSPSPTTGVTTVSDPLGSIVAPTVSSTCGTATGTYSGTNGTMNPSTGGTTNVGVYCGGISITGDSVVTMNPGIYIVNGGGFNVGNSAKVTGSNVMIFLAGQHGQTNGPMTLGGDCTVTLTAPNGGTYEGILFFQGRTATYASANTFGNSAKLTGSSGTFYFPGTTMTLSGSVSSSTLAFVVKDLTVSASATLNDDKTGALTGLAPRSTALLQ